VLDEAQNIKDAESSRFRAIGNLRSKRRLLLTGELPSRALLACLLAPE
jgi:SNF2 family DNA or RNA helicase